MPSRYPDEVLHPTLVSGAVLYSVTNRDHIEEVHKEALRDRQVKHRQVQDAALAAIHQYQIEQEALRLRELEEHGRRTLEAEQNRANLEAKVAELQRRKVERVEAARKLKQVKPDTPEPAARTLTTEELTRLEFKLTAELERDLDVQLGTADSPPVADPTVPAAQKTVPRPNSSQLPQPTQPTLATQPKWPAQPSHPSQLLRPPQPSQLPQSLQTSQKSQSSQPSQLSPTLNPSLPRSRDVPLETASPKAEEKPAILVTVDPPKLAKSSVVTGGPASATSAHMGDNSHFGPGAQKLLRIHHTLKQLRSFMNEGAKQQPELKKKMGDGRREIRKSVGQLTEGKPGANKQPLAKILNCLKDALSDNLSPKIDPGLVMLKKPNRLDNPQALNNGETLPALFIYLLNQFSKSVIRQLLDEAGVKSKAANPIGVVVANIFAKPENQFRGAPLIDILMAKFRVTCPVLFGIRGNETTNEGRARLGWWKVEKGGDWVSEQVHLFRMTGLASGYAAIALRDFSKSKMENPYPPTNYWMSMAMIVSTPHSETSPTLYTVLKAMTNGYEQRFLNAYGHAAKAALQVALVNFPAQQNGRVPAANQLMVLGDKLMRDSGLHFDFPAWWT